MRMGVREFRDRVSEIVNGDAPVVVTNNGRRVGTYLPERRHRDPAAASRAVESMRRWQEEMRAGGIDLEARLAEAGLSPMGEPLADR